MIDARPLPVDPRFPGIMSRALKRLLVRSLDPLDTVVRRINGKGSQPPLHLRWEVGPLRGFESAAAEYRLYLQIFGGMRPDSHLLDIGCGCGQMALELAGHMSREGAYEGWDINAEAIRWCEKAIAGRDPRFTFRVLNVRNGLYKPYDGEDAASFRLPSGSRFDLILLKSVLTHMLRDEVANYLRQIPGLLATGGRCIASFFLLNDRQRSWEGRGENRIAFHHFRDGMAAANPAVPEAIVAYEESDVLALLHDSGLRLAQPVIAGGWVGDPAALSHQDILVLERG